MNKIEKQNNDGQYYLFNMRLFYMRFLSFQAVYGKFSEDIFQSPIGKSMLKELSERLSERFSDGFSVPVSFPRRRESPNHNPIKTMP